MNRDHFDTKIKLALSEWLNNPENEDSEDYEEIQETYNNLVRKHEKNNENPGQ